MLLTRMRRDDGQVSLAVVLLSLVIIAAAVGVFIFGEAQDSRTRAQKGADASSLAAAKDVREQLIRDFSTAHTPPPPAAGPAIPADATAVVSGLGSKGQSAAYEFAGKNETKLSDYRYSGNAFTSLVQSEEDEVDSPVGNEARKSLSSPAEATAEIVTDISCWSGQVDRNPETQEVLRWQIICNGNGHTATINYFNSGTSSNDFASHMDDWRKVFKVRLKK